MSEDGLEDREFECVVEGCQTSISISDTRRGYGVIITYESFLPPYLDVFAWCANHIPEFDDDTLKQRVRDGEIEWSPSIREMRSWPGDGTTRE